MFKANRLIEWRKKRGLTQEQLAHKIKTTKGTISNYENGHSTPPNETLVAIADVLGVSTDYLLGRTNDPTPPRNDKADNQTKTREEIEDPELGLWFKELLDAPEERREELRKIWEIIKQREAGRNPGDKQGE